MKPVVAVNKTSCLTSLVDKKCMMTVVCFVSLFTGALLTNELCAESQKSSATSVKNVSVGADLNMCNEQEIPGGNDTVLPILFRGDLSPANAAYTINRPGVYKLTSAKTASGVPNISIMANNVTLDLGGNLLSGGTNGIEITGNNVTVKNGAITGMTQNGVLVKGNGCHVEGLDISQCTTGITLESCHQCAVDKCSVRNTTQAGVSLHSTWTSSVQGCSVSGVQYFGDAYGFIAENGGNNTFNGCIASDVRTTYTINTFVDVAGWVTAQSGGIMLRNEQGSSVLASQAYAITADPQAKNAVCGIGTLPGATLTYADALLSVTHSPYAEDFVYSVAWLVQGEDTYLASGGYPFDDTGNQIKIYRFDAATSSLLSVTHSPDADGFVWSVAWLVKGEDTYLASGGVETNEVKIYRFDAATSSLLSITHSPYAEIIVSSVAWLVKGEDTYLASGGIGTNKVKIYRFDAATSSLLSVTHSPYAEGAVSSVAWLVQGEDTYLASGGAGTNEIKIYRFDAATSSLLSVTHSPYAEGAVSSVAWLVQGENTYLASGGEGTNEIKIYRFDAATSSLLSVTHSRYAEDIVLSVAWLVQGESTYLASGGHPSGDTGNQVKIYKFDGFSQQQSEHCQCINNTVRDIHSEQRSLAAVGGVPVGTGLYLSTTHHYVAQNTAYDCDISFAGVSSDYITSQANARGVYNIDTSLTTPDVVPLIVDQALTVESKLDSLVSELVTIESKLDYLTACDYEALSAPTTLSTDYGAYCLSADMAGDLQITGTGITFCLNGHTITGGTNGIVVSGDEVVLKNGTVRNATASGIKITGDKCLLENITSVGNVTGFELNGADNTVMRSCVALDNTREGFLLTNAQKNFFEQCEAINTSGAGTVAGFKTTDGTGNRFIECKVNGVTSSSGQAYGMVGLHETASEFADSTIMNITASTYAAGVALVGDYLSTPTVQDFFITGTRISLSIDWLNTPVGSYIATEGSTSPNANIRVNLLDPTSGISATYYTGLSFGISGSRARWLTWNGTYYVAMSGINSLADSSGKIYVYTFSPATGISSAVATYNDNYDFPCVGLAWVLSGNIPYLLYTRQLDPVTAAEFVCLEFNGTSLTLRPPYVHYTGGFPTNINPHLVNGSWNLAVTGVTGADVTEELVRIYTFDDPQGSASLTLTTSYDTVTNGSVYYSGSWLDYNGDIYYAIGINNNSSSPTVRVLKYTDSPASLTLFASYDYSAAAQSVDFFTTGTTVYLAVSGNKTNARVEILKFDPYQSSVTTRLSSYYVCSGENQAGTEIRWNRVAGVDNRVYLGVAKISISVTDPYLRVYGFDINDQSELCLVSNDVVSGVPDGEGILVDPVVNSAYNSATYNCFNGFEEAVRTSYSPQQPFDTSNRAVPSI